MIREWVWRGVRVERDPGRGLVAYKEEHMDKASETELLERIEALAKLRNRFMEQADGCIKNAREITSMIEVLAEALDKEIVRCAK